MQPLFLKPVFQERIWGGTALRDKFGYSIPSEKTGECWAISAHPNGPSFVENGPHAGMSLNGLWKAEPGLFGNPTKEVFPLLTKILDAAMDLSVQVHPDDTYAAQHEKGELGKTECWYIVDCKEDADMIFGHTASTREELEKKIEEGKWDELLRRVKIKPGDFFYVPSGTIHALLEGTLVLEIQQSSDTTYRVFDYNRRDDKGNLRELHLDKAIDVTTIPHEDCRNTNQSESVPGAEITSFIQSEFFSVSEWDVKGKASLSYPETYLLASVIEGSGTLGADGEVYKLNKGQHFIVPIGIKELTIEGDCRLIVSHP
ncbi:mannose-6-phosphate isomerase, class I [Peribacillus sp. SCS-37]|uniref:mannose-6-phosphate isomerase, class I n=1 Tax=Paraperibacillus esterisolvens TaxID=3115296 RepID=UPI003906B21B